MRFKILFIGMFVCLLHGSWAQPSAEMDTPETLRWAELQARKIDTLLDNAILSYEQVNLFLKLTEAYLIFDAVAMTGLYCPEVRNAAHNGRNLCDVINFRLEKDMNATVTRAAQARQEAARMMQGARRCLNNDLVQSAAGVRFAPNEIIQLDAELAIHDLTDGLMAGNFHILAQKIEHAIRLLHDIDHLAATLDRCGAVRDHAQEAIREAEKALAAYNWTEANLSVKRAINAAKRIASDVCE